MKTCSTIRGSILQFYQMASSQKIHTINLIIKKPHHPTKNHTIIIISNLTTNATNQPLLSDRNASHSRPPQAVFPRMFQSLITRNSNLHNLARHSCSRHKGHYLQGHLQTSKMLYVQYRKIRNLITQSGSSGSSAITCSWKSRLPGHLLTSKMLYVQYRRICYFFTQIGPKRICNNTLQETETTCSAANHQHAVCSISHSLQFKHPIGSEQICHLIILLEIKTTNSTANFQNVVCLISHSLLLNHPIGPKRICHHSILMDIEPATFQNAVCSISQNLLLIHPIGPKRIAITYPWRPRTLLDTRAHIFNNPNKEDNITIHSRAGT